MSVPPRLAIPLLLLTGACTLVDQRTFNPQAGRAPVVAAAPAPLVVAPLDPQALFTLREPAVLDSASLAALAGAVRAARARKPSAAFTVVAIVPTADANIAPATSVQRAIVELGVAPALVALRAETGSPAEVRVYVR